MVHLRQQYDGNDFTPLSGAPGRFDHLDQPAVFGKTTRLIEMPVSWTLDDHPHFEFIRTKEWILPGLMNANLLLSMIGSTISLYHKEFELGSITTPSIVCNRRGRASVDPGKADSKA